jgi:nucleotide-binding universal stress UspA family protein
MTVSWRGGDPLSLTLRGRVYTLYDEVISVENQERYNNKVVERSNTVFHRILVPLDGSSRAEQALPVAARLAHFSGGTIVLLRVVSPSPELGPYPVPDPWTIQPLNDADLVEARNYLDHISSVSVLIGVNTETTVIAGQSAATILSVVDTHHIDLIVLCSHGYTGMKRWALGSVAEKVAHHAPVPVLVLREGGPALVGTPPHAEGPLRALIPLDGSAGAKAVIVPAAQLVVALSAPGPGALHFTRVVVLPDAEQISQSEREAIMHKAKQYLSATVEHIRESLVASPVADLKLAMTWSVTIDDDLASAIIRVAEDGENTQGTGVFDGSDLIAMATHGYGGLQRWAMGSVTGRVLYATRFPLLIVRPSDVLDKWHQTQDKTIKTGVRE